MAVAEQNAQLPLSAYPTVTTEPPTDHLPRRLCQRWTVVGHGMVAQRFCERVVENGLLRRIELTVVGDEAAPPYDRVRLSHALRSGEVPSLVLRPLAWFSSHGIQRVQGQASILDRKVRRVIIEGGQHLSYDHLVLATGSRAILPALPGCDHPRVFVYRTLEDALRLRATVMSTAPERRSALVVGAGLLGLETAEALSDLGCRVTVVEADDRLLPRQLDVDLSGLLQARIEGRGLRLRIGAKVRAITEEGDDTVTAELSCGSRSTASVVVFAVGVRPRDELALKSGISCDLFGGVIVDESLQTSDPRIFAVGECARYGGQSYGLVAPGYAMADVLVERMMGRPRSFSGMKPNLRLKLRELDVTAMGESTASGVGIHSVVRRRGDEHVRLVLHRNRLTGIAAVGSPADLPSLQQALVRGDRLSNRACRRFERGHPLLGTDSVDVRTWPQEATVCSCNGVTRKALEDARRSGATSLDALMASTRAGTACGSCRPLLLSLTGEVAAPKRQMVPLLCALATAQCVAIALVAPSLPYATSARAPSPLELIAEGARTFAWKQLSGWLLLAIVFVLGAYSIRQKLPLGNRRGLLSAHLVLGLVAALLLSAHTGLRLGHGIDRALAVTMLMVLGAGAAAALAFGMRTSPLSATRRQWTRRIHSWVTWPLPVLVLIHVLKVYWF